MNRTTLVSFALIPFAAASALAQETPCPSLANQVITITHLIAAGEGTKALEHARASLDRCPSERVLVRTLAAAQKATGDHVGAIATLAAHLADDPLDCESWSWLAWLEMARNNNAAAAQALFAPGCPATPAEKGRASLFEVRLAKLLGDHRGAQSSLAQIKDRSILFPEDGTLWAFLKRGEDRAWRPPLETRLDVSLGSTSNAFAGSPTDTSRSAIASTIGRFAFSGRLLAPRHGFITPLAELDVRGHAIAKSQAKEFSYLDLDGRVGIEAKLGAARARLLYRQDAFFLNVSSHSRYAHAQRGEIELELANGVEARVGAGRRKYLDPWRTRRELDAGLVGPVALGTTPISFGVSLRRYHADRSVWDQQGATVTAVLRLNLGRGYVGRLGVFASRDEFPHSGGLDGLFAFGSDEIRKDTAFRLSLSAWRHLSSGMDAAVGYEFTKRFSTIDPGFFGSFAYTEHRLLATLRFSSATNPWRSRTDLGRDRIPLDYDLDSALPLSEERGRDLLRQDEELRKGCGCK